MRAGLPQAEALRRLGADGWLLFGTRFVRLFAYGLLSAGLMGVPALAGLPFFLAGGIKIAYDLLLFRVFAAVAPDKK